MFNILDWKIGINMEMELQHTSKDDVFEKSILENEERIRLEEEENFKHMRFRMVFKPRKIPKNKAKSKK